jgi:hypothetical protein
VGICIRNGSTVFSKQELSDGALRPYLLIVARTECSGLIADPSGSNVLDSFCQIGLSFTANVSKYRRMENHQCGVGGSLSREGMRSERRSPRLICGGFCLATSKNKIDMMV